MVFLVPFSLAHREPFCIPFNPFVYRFMYRAMDSAASRVYRSGMAWTEKDVRVTQKKSRGGMYYVIIPGVPGWKSSGKLRKSEAIEWALVMAEGGIPADVTIGEYARDMFILGKCRYIALMEGSKGKNGEDYWTQQRHILETYILPAWGSTILVALAPDRLFKWVTSPNLLTVGSINVAPRPVSSTWRNKILTVFHQVYRLAVFERMVTSNVIESIPRLVHDRAPRGAYTANELSQLFPASDEALVSVWGSMRWALLGMVLADTGVRPSEALALRWSDWHPADGAFVVARRVDPRGTIGALKTAKKGVDRRAALVGPRTASLLEAERGEALPADLVFPTHTFKRLLGAPMKVPVVNRRFKEALARAGVVRGNRVLYSLRHTANTGFRTELGDEAAQLLMGHVARSGMTETYDHPEDAALIARARKASGRLPQAE